MFDLHLPRAFFAFDDKTFDKKKSSTWNRTFSIFMSYLRFDILQDVTLLNYKHKTIPRFKDIERSCCN